MEELQENIPTVLTGFVTQILFDTVIMLCRQNFRLSLMFGKNNLESMQMI